MQNNRVMPPPICFLLLIASELNAEQHVYASTDVVTYGMILLWVCIGDKAISQKPNGKPQLKRIDADARAKGFLSSLLCCGRCMETK